MIIEVYVPPVSGGFSIVPVDGSNKQLYDADTGEFTPDFRLVPAAFQIKGWKIEADQSGEVTTFVDVLVHELVNGSWVEKTSSSALEINYTAGLIKIKENNEPGATRQFRVDFKVANTHRPSLPLIESQEFAVISDIQAASPYSIRTEYPRGQQAIVIDKLPNYGIRCPLYRGDEEWIQAYYRWYRRVNGVDMEITASNASGITGVDTREIHVPFGELTERGNTYKCIADPAVDLTGINLISKSMISDDWNAIKAGISTPGEDADGKYFAINQSELYTAFNNGTEDIFGWKIKYKTNQQYRLSVNWKLQSQQESAGLYIVFVYTDGTSDRVIISGSQTSKIMDSITSPPGKTVQKIRSTYGSSIVRTLIYDIQLVEYYGADNLVSRGAYARIPASGVATGNESKAFYINKEMAAKLTPGTKVTLSIESVNILAGKASGLAFNIYDGVNQSTGEGLPLSSLKVTRTIKSSPNPVSNPYISIYGGEHNNMVGNAIELRGVMLVIGETAYKYSPAEGEFLPAIPDGAPKPPISSKALTEITALSKLYPNQVEKTNILVSQSNNLSGGNAYTARCQLDTARGTIEKPELSYSCIWKSKDDTGVWKEFAKGFNIAGTFDKKIQIESMYERGLDNAKWAANFNGIDQYLGNNNPTNLFPWGVSEMRTHVVEFIINSLPESVKMVVQICAKSSSESYGFALAIYKDGRLQYRVGREDGATGSDPTVYYGTTIMEPGKLYRVEVAIARNGSYTAKINGVAEKFSGVGGAIYGSAHIRIGLGTAGTYFNGKVLRYIVFDTENSLYAEWDFQPNNGDRANMLKVKNSSGNALESSTLLPYNIPGINNTDPENGFFVTI